MTIKIPVQADLDQASLERQIKQLEQKLNQLGRTISQSSKAKFEPVNVKSLQDLEKYKKSYEQLLQLDADFRRRVSVTGQSGVGFANLDFGKLNISQARMGRIYQYVTGANASGGGAGSGGGGGRGSAWGQMGANIAQAGMRAAGPVGGVAAGAFGTGMSAGFGAGMAGLLGGLGALGIGKIVGAVADNVRQAENSAVAYDKLKRTLGDVNVSFAALKTAIGGSVQGASGFATSNHLGIGDAIALVSRYSRSGGISGGNISGLLSEAGVGVGMSRAYGLDPSQGVDALGSARGLRYTRSEQDTRRFALLIGETIGKSGAFSKADEVMESINSYVSTQARQSLSANPTGYAGMFSGLVGSGMTGMDPSGAAAMLSRVNSSLAAGGAKGEASQFFSALVGQRAGLDPVQTQILREGGAFATINSMFGPNSAAARYGIKGPTGGLNGDKTWLQLTMEQLHSDRSYGKDKELFAQALANHTGIGINQAMMLASTAPQSMGALMGGLQKAGVDINSVNMGGLNMLSRVITGTGADRLGVASDLYSRTGKDKLSDAERAKLNNVMRSGSLDDQKDLLTKLVASRDQEETQGKDIRDSKVALENISENLASKLIPATNGVRDAVLYMAGGGRKSPAAMLRDMQVTEIDEKIAAQKRIKDIAGSNAGTGRGFIKRPNADADIKAADAEIKRLQGERADILSGKAPASGEGQSGGSSTPNGWRSYDNPATNANGEMFSESTFKGKMAAAEIRYGLPAGTLSSVATQEVGRNLGDYLADPSKFHYKLDANGRRIAAHTGKVSTAFGPFGILESTAARPGYGVSPLKDKSVDEQIRFTAEYLAARSRAAGSLSGGLAGYGEGTSYARSVMSRIGTPMPADAAAARSNDTVLRGGFEPLRVIHENTDGTPYQLPEYLNPYFNRTDTNSWSSIYPSQK